MSANFLAFCWEQGVRKGRSHMVVLSKNSGSLFGYAGTLNELGYYSVSLCVCVQEVADLLGAGGRIEYLVYDGFDLGKDADRLQMLIKHNAINSIIAVADVNSRQRKKIMLWARAYRVPLRGVLQAPLRPGELHELIELSSVNIERSSFASGR
ncbi:hypothetical protein PSH76_09630 [Pseudomonas sp. FP215]|uniref:hypothetical protein n=1 Tax=Pseudomonas sp. FP215 TaxID=2738126 RepID=UPI0027335861|nr:hypothetical protein [Pseudomonas sp. FP215]WLH26064.1 hypothetical protein PSH76_09630 [Pseudomonas sp. FP215]